MKKLLFLFQIATLVITVMIMGGCHKQPQATHPTVITPCDSIIQALIDSIQENSFSNDFGEWEISDPEVLVPTPKSIDTVLLTSDCSYYQLKALQLAKEYAQAIKERDYYKSISKAKKIVNNYNSNNKVKNSTVGDGNIDAGKKSTVGDGNTVDQSKKTNWFWIFLSGVLTCLLVDKVILPKLFNWTIPGFRIIKKLT